MGLFSRLFNKTAKADGETPEIHSRVPQAQNQGEWEYLGDPASLIETDGKFSGLDFTLNVKDAIPVSATLYMQDVLSTFDEDTIDVRIVLPKDVRQAPDDWQYFDGPKSAQVVDRYGRLLGNLPDYKLSKTGYSIGDTARAAVTKPPAGGTHYGLHILIPKDVVEALERSRERARIERFVGKRVPENADTAIKNINNSEWHGPRSHGSPKQLDIETSIIPTPKGSQAKPHIRISFKGTELFEANARMECYKVLAKHVGERPFCATYQRFDSLSETERYYWKVTIVYEAK